MKKLLGVIVAITVVVILSGALIAAVYAAEKESANGNRFIAYDNGTVLDRQTGLMWAAKDNGSDIDWSNAKRYCENYRGGDYTDWRLPTQDELVGLYESNKSRPGACAKRYNIHVATELIDITCFALWASETSGSLSAYFLLGDGLRYWDQKLL